ncbi:MAG TPA: macrolide family glycosyltransferase [Ktedonobacteraceae bacterium]|jgi:MGT family glycosyltransferase
MTGIAFFNSPFHGHVNPTLPIAQELVRRGIRVDYYLTAHFREAVEATAAVFHPLTVSLASSTAAAETLSLRIAQESCRLVPELLDDLRARQPDCIVYDAACLWGRLLAHILGVPAVAIYCSYALNIHVLRLGTHQRSASTAGSPQAFLQMYQVLEKLRARYQLPPPGNLFAQAEALNIVCVPREFQPASESFDARFIFVGLPMHERHAEAVDFPFARLDERPLLYISLGTLVNDRLSFYRRCLAAFGDQPWQVVLSLGERVAQEALGPLPSNVIVRPFVPQLAILQRARVFLTHGGTNSVMEALTFAVPLVVVPRTPEHTVAGRRVAELGLGLTIEEDEAPARALWDAVTTVGSDAAIQSNVERMASILQHAGGQRMAAEAILQFVARRAG